MISVRVAPLARCPQRYAQASAATLPRVTRAGELAWFMLIGLGCQAVEFFDFCRKNRSCTSGQNSYISLPSTSPVRLVATRLAMTVPVRLAEIVYTLEAP